MKSIKLIFVLINCINSFVPKLQKVKSRFILYSENNNYLYSKEYYEYLVEQNIINNHVEDDILDDILLGSSNNKYIYYSKIRESNYKIFEKNYLKIKKFNNDCNTCNLELNKFTDQIDMDDHQVDLMRESVKKTDIFKNRFIGIKKILKNPIEYFKNYTNLPDEKIWDEDILSDVKNQGYCGSCWAFSTTSSIESLMRINNYTIERLSEQELVDCSTENNGCGGGLMHKAFDYCIKKGGLSDDKDYPYIAENQKCKINCNTTVLFKNVNGSNIKNYDFIIPRSVSDMMLALQKGPVCIAVDADSFVFRFYKNGVIDIPNKKFGNINHAVLLTGYATDVNGSYWIIQNSWGEDWGDNGFAKIRIKEGNGILLSQLYGVYPLY